MTDKMPWEEDQVPTTPEQTAAALTSPDYNPQEWAGVRIAPDKDLGLQTLLDEGARLQVLAENRTILTNDDIAPATSDLAVIARTLKMIEAKREEYTKPLNAFLKQINAYFKDATAPFAAADRINRDKVRVFLAEVERRRREAEAIEAEKLALARREAELNAGEHTVDLSPVPAPPPAPARVYTQTGSMSTRKEARWELTDLSRVPAEYLMLDTAKVGRVVRAGVREIPGIRIWEEQNIAVRT